jgi:hypothetical protein
MNRVFDEAVARGFSTHKNVPLVNLKTIAA